MAIALGVLLVAAVGYTQVPTFESVPDRAALPDWTRSWSRFVAGWSGFLSWQFLAAQAAELMLSAGLALVLALHPRNYSHGYVSNTDVVEQPKVLSLYAVVATMVAEVVQVSPAMAFVIFGIGGLLRFRTDMGLPKLTGRAILATVVGLCVGLELFPLAVLGTAFGWLLIYVLESRATVRVTVSKLPADRITESAASYREVLEEQGCRTISEWIMVGQGQFQIIILAPTTLDKQQLGADVRAKVPGELQGKLSVKVA